MHTIHSLLTLVALPIAAALAPPPSIAPQVVAIDATKETSEGFVAIFDGKTLEKWTGDSKGYKVEEGTIVCQPGGTNLFTVSEYGDFELRFEFQLSAGANNGIALRAPLEGDPAYAGFESQILDNSADMYKDLKAWQYHGSLYGVAAATANALKPVGEWNSESITMKGSIVKIQVNGVTIVDVDLAKVAPEGKTVSENKVNGLTRAKGHIGFCGHGDRVAYRNLRVRAM